MLRACYTREPTNSDLEPERTHDDCQWLNEKDGEEDVPGDGSDGNRCVGPPRIGGNQRRNRYGNDDADT